MNIDLGTLAGSHPLDVPVWENWRRPSSTSTGKHTSGKGGLSAYLHCTEIQSLLSNFWLVKSYAFIVLMGRWVVSVPCSLNPIYIFMSRSHLINFCCLFIMFQIISSKNWVQLNITWSTENFSFVYVINILFNLLTCCTGLNICE